MFERDKDSFTDELPVSHDEVQRAAQLWANVGLGIMADAYSGTSWVWIGAVSSILAPITDGRG